MEIFAYHPGLKKEVEIGNSGLCLLLVFKQEAVCVCVCVCMREGGRNIVVLLLFVLFICSGVVITILVVEFVCCSNSRYVSE